MPRQLPPAAERVLDATLACIARVGMGKTTLDDVAREAGCARATVYRYFPNKQRLLTALVEREADAVGARIVAAAAGAPTLLDAVVATVTAGATELQSHAALTFVAMYEPEQLLPYLAFERENVVLGVAGALVAPAFEPFLPHERAARLGEWIARMTFSYLCSPSETLDVVDGAQVRALVEDFVLPGFVRTATELDTVEGVSR
jgi:AcrR family transcriptional regulator